MFGQDTGSDKAEAVAPPPPGSAAPAPKAEARRGGGGALGINRHPIAKPLEKPGQVGKVTRKKDVREYTDEEKAAWKRERQLENARKAAKARKWIGERFAKRGRTPAICQCGKSIKGQGGKVYLTEESTIWHNKIQCRSWACPVCAPKRAWARAYEIQEALVAANAKGYRQLFITFTIPHTAKQRTKTVLKHLNGAYRTMRNDSAFRKLLEGLGYVGQVKALDFTLTDNGTHAHFHTVYIFDTALDCEAVAERARAVMLESWDKAVRKECGRGISRSHGFDVECIELPQGDEEQAEALALYAAKVISIYSSSPDKSKGSVTPFDLLERDDEESKERFLDWYEGQKGIRRIVFGRGLKAKLGIGAVEFDVPDQALVASVSSEAVDFLRDEESRQRFESMAAGSDCGSALDWLQEQTGAVVLRNISLISELARGIPVAECVRAEAERAEAMCAGFATDP